VVFTVNERLTGRPPIPNDEIAAFAAENADIMFAFAALIRRAAGNRLTKRDD
jgi:hypothetical protein